MNRNVGIYVYDQVEVLDFAGPFEVFHTASRVWLRSHPDEEAPFRVFTIGLTGKPVMARGELQVVPHHPLPDAPAIDLLILPGGVTAQEQGRQELIEWIKERSGQAEITASVCTGAFLLAEAGLLEGRRVTTHWEDIDPLRKSFPTLQVVEEERFIDSGDIVTSAGISAGIDMSLHLVARLMGEELARQTARQMDYRCDDYDGSKVKPSQ